MNLSQSERFAFNQFADVDELNGFDSEIENFDAELNELEGGRPGKLSAKRSQITLTITNPVQQDMWVELFNYLNSFVKVFNSQLVNAAATGFGYFPLETREGIEALLQANAQTGTGANAPIVAGTGYVGFDRNGDLVITGATNAIAPVRISATGRNVNYRKLFEASGRGNLAIHGIRATFSQQNQIAQDLNYTSSSIVGGAKENSISPRAYFKPDQFQNLIVDIPVSSTINKHSGFQYLMKAAPSGSVSNTVEMNIYLSY